MFDIPLLGRAGSSRSLDWVRGPPALAATAARLFGASTGAAAALLAAAGPATSRGGVSRGGRPDLAGDRLAEVRRRPC